MNMTNAMIKRGAFRRSNFFGFAIFGYFDVVTWIWVEWTSYFYGSLFKLNGGDSF
jgi:hypothetical protein